jgi:hypothetical protein
VPQSWLARVCNPCRWAHENRQAIRRTATAPTSYRPTLPHPQSAVDESVRCVFINFLEPLESGLLTHLTRLTRLCTRRRVRLPNDPAALPSAGASLRVLELAHDGYGGHRAAVEALLPVAAGLEALDVGESSLTPAEAARLAAVLPRDIPRLHIATWGQRAWSALPITSLELRDMPADLALVAGASRLERLSLETISDADPTALAAALQALPRLQVLRLGGGLHRAFEPAPLPEGGPAAPLAAVPAGAGAGDAPPTAKAVGAFVAAVAGLPSLRELGLAGFHIGREAKAALLQAAPRLSALRLAVCGLGDRKVAALAAQLREAAGRGTLPLLEVDAWSPRCWLEPVVFD